jgi:hypothetical protein
MRRPTFGFIVSVILVVGALGLAGCAVPQRGPIQTQPVPQRVAMQTKFDPGEHKRYTEAGSSSIKGQGFLQQKGGGIVTCAGKEVLLWPATSFVRELIGHLRAGKDPEFSGTVDPQYRSIFKQSQCDAQGNFFFSQLPSGTWIVFTEVRWTVGYADQGGNLLREVTLSSGEAAHVLLSDKDFISR